jgi:DNA polymerase III subunit epsilon
MPVLPAFTLPADPIVFVDLETTGATFGLNRITEIGIVEAGPAGITQWSSLVNPQQPIPSFIQQLTGITDSMVRHAPTFEELAQSLHERMDGRLFVAHNVHFDHGFLRGEFKRTGRKFQPDLLCTVQLSRAIDPLERRHGLDALVERHALVPSARHRALADADLLWQFWQHLHRSHPLETLHAHMDQVMQRFRLARDIDQDTIEQIPAGCGIYTFFGENDEPLFVGRSVRLRQRVRSHLTGAKRSAKDLRLAQLVQRVEWMATGGEIGALLAEARAVGKLRPPLNRIVRQRRDESRGAAWPYPGAIAIEERDPTTAQPVWHVVDNWQYFGTCSTFDEAPGLRAATAVSGFEPATYRILGERLGRGMKVVPLTTDFVA